MNTARTFQRKIENFTCRNCGCLVKGNGYTNHCPKCLFSLHVDINPGDRSAKCHGLMRPLSLQKKNGELKILHFCTLCGHKRLNRVNADDNPEMIIELSSRIG